MAKKLKMWNGRGLGRLNNYHISVAAYSQKQAAELVSEASGIRAGISEIRDYYSPCWGNSMDGITPEIPCVWIEVKHSGQPKRII